MSTLTTTPMQEAYAKADALLARLTLAEKLGQMLQAERAWITADEVAQHHVGSVLSGGGSVPGENRLEDWLAMQDAYWTASMRTEGGRTPIPVLYGIDAIHGNANVKGATVFPHQIGLGAAGDESLVERIGRACAAEVLATGLDWNFAPCLAVAQDIRWGRTYESFDETPGPVGRYGAAFLRGLQDGFDETGVMGCPKHWVGDGGTTGGFDQGDTAVSAEELEHVHLAPYLPALEAGAITVMASFSSWNREKCHGSRHLLTDVLKGRLGFDGFVISDWDGVDQLADDLDVSLATALNAGIDMVMVAVDWRRMLEALFCVVADGRVPMARIDDAVRRILAVKYRMGLFERGLPSARPHAGAAALGCSAHRALAREAVQKSLVLLKHEGGVLPIAPTARVLVAGRNADDRGRQCGGFTIAWQGVSGNDAIVGGTSIFEGIREYAPAAELSTDGAAADRARHDVAIVVIGENPYAEGQGDLRKGGAVPRGPGTQYMTILPPYGDTLEYATLHPEDLAAIRRIRAAGIPVVTVLVSGRPLLVNRELEASDAFVAAWLPGSEGGGVADVLFGAVDFSGRLGFTWPASDDGARRSRISQFPRGYGLRLRVS